jgi:predicted dehydrogenase
LKRAVIIGGETHIAEITQLAGSELEVSGVYVREDQRDKAAADFKATVYASEDELYAEARPEIVAVANENDRKAKVVLRALAEGCDVVVDKPLAITSQEQEAIQDVLRARPERRVLMLLTLRGASLWAGMRQVVQSGAVGAPSFCHVRMAVRLKREQRPPWFLDVRHAGGLFLDLLIHGIDQVEWATGSLITAMTATTGNLSDPAEEHLRDHASVFCELDNGGSAVIEGQRMLPDSKASDYRMLVAGTRGYADLCMAANTLTVTTPEGADVPVAELPEQRSIVSDWLAGGGLVDGAASLRANRLAILATLAAEQGSRLEVPNDVSA